MLASPPAASRNLRLLMLEGRTAQAARQLANLIPVVTVHATSQMDEVPQTHGRQPFDVAFVDLESCGPAGTVIERLRGMDPGLPIVVLAQSAGEDEALQWLERGAQDYLLKDQLTLDNLVRSLRYAMRLSKLERRLMLLSGGLEKTHQRLCEVSSALARRRQATLERGTHLLRKEPPNSPAYVPLEDRREALAIS
jgi:DNA-binding NarL/FixJ family response regulator